MPFLTLLMDAYDFLLEESRLEKRLGEKPLWVIIAGLVLLNCLTVAFFLTRQEPTPVNNEVVATVGKAEITRQDWLSVMETRYGKDVLKELIDQKVIDTLAKKYDVKVSDEAIERELLLIKTMYGSTTDETTSEKEWKEQIKSTLLLEEILTKDVIVPEAEMKAYYDENLSLYRIPTSYHVSQIIVKTLEEAKRTIQELNQGSNFATLAMERSIDEFSASQGGDMGFIREEDENISEEFMAGVKKLSPGEWSEPIKATNGYAIALLHDRIKGKEYSYNEVKNEIRRLIALEQMDGHSNVDAFWNEVNVEWFYGEHSLD